MQLIDENNPIHPNIMSVDAGEVFVGGRYHSLVPILKEVYENNNVSSNNFQQRAHWQKTNSFAFYFRTTITRWQLSRRARFEGDKGLLCQGRLSGRLDSPDLQTDGVLCHRDLRLQQPRQVRHGLLWSVVRSELTPGSVQSSGRQFSPLLWRMWIRYTRGQVYEQRSLRRILRSFQVSIVVGVFVALWSSKLRSVREHQQLHSLLSGAIWHSKQLTCHCAKTNKLPSFAFGKFPSLFSSGLVFAWGRMPRPYSAQLVTYSIIIALFKCKCNCQDLDQ